MHIRFRIILGVLIGALISIQAQTYGDSSKKQSSDSAKDRSCQATKSCCSALCYPCSFEKDKKGEVLFRGDFLGWKSKLSGLEGAFGTTLMEERDNGVGQIVTTFTESDQRPDFKWRAGFRLGTDLLFHCFGTEFDWTHIRGSADYHRSNQKGNWSLKYDTLDLIFGYKFSPCSHFYVKPFIGLRYAKIDQKLKSHLHTTLIKATGTTYPIIDIDHKEDFDGLGPQVGVESLWYMGLNLSLYGEVDFVIYYGHVDGHYDHIDTLSNAIYVSKWKKDRSFNCIGMGGEIGIRWDYCPNEDVHLMLKLGAEQHRICDFSDLGSDGALAIAGVVLEGGIGIRF